MLTLKDYVNWGITHCDKTASAEGVPLVMENCVKNKKMKQLEVYGNSVQNGTPSPEAPVEVESVGGLVTDLNDTNYGKYKIPVTVRGKNLYDSKSYPITQGYYIHGGNGSYNSNASFAAIQDFIPCDRLQGKMITINHTGGSNPGIAFYNNNKGYLSGKANGSSANTSISVVVPNNAHYYRFCVQNSYADVAMVEYGNAPTDYEPYVEPITTNIYLNEPLRKIGDYADVIDFKGKKVVRNMRELVFDGAESWGLLGTGDANLWGFMLYIKSPYLRATSYAADCSLCNMYPVVKSRADKTLSGQSSSRNRFDFIDLDYADVDAWKAHLAELSANGTPIKIVYALELPYEELIDCELPTLNAKTTVIDIDTSILLSNIKGKYIKR